MGQLRSRNFILSMWVAQCLAGLILWYLGGLLTASLPAFSAFLLGLSLTRERLPAHWMVSFLHFSLAYYSVQWPQYVAEFSLSSCLLFSLWEVDQYKAGGTGFCTNLAVWTLCTPQLIRASADPVETAVAIVSAHFLSLSAWRLKVMRRNESSESWNNVFRAYPDGVIVMEESSLHCNQNTLELLEVSSESEVKEKLKCSQVQELMKNSTCGKDCFTESERKRVEWRSTSWGGKVVIFLRDFSVWRECEKAAADESSRREALLRSLSHDLRSPINAIINLGDELRESMHGKELLTLQIIASSARFLLSTVNDLLDCALLCAGKFVLKLGPFRGEEAFRECVQMIEAQCKLKGITVVLRYDRSLPAIIHSDHSRLRQVLLNLLSNAVKFTLKGHIEVVALYTTRRQMRISVVDSGIGIPQELQSKLQTMFQLVGKSVKTCCLGLSISNAIVQHLSGRSLTISSAPGKGSVVSFEIPITENPFSDVLMSVEDESCLLDETRGEVSLPLFSVPQEGAQVLIVDDSEFNRLVLLRILESNGYRCHEAYTGLQALAAVRKRLECGACYQVILMDVDMPEMDGVTATKELRDMVLSGELHTMPIVVACSAFSAADHEDLCMEAGMSYYLEKPISRDALLRLLSRILPLECSLAD